MKAQATILQFILLFALSVALFSFLSFFMYSYYSNFRKELSKELTELLGSIFLNHFVYLSKECDCGENFYLERSFSTFNLSISPTRLALSEMNLSLELPIYHFFSSSKLHNLNYSYNFFSAKGNYLFDVKGKKFSLLHNKTHLILDEFPPSIKIYISPPEVIPPQPPTQPTPPFLDGYTYRIPIFIQENSGNDLIDYQVLVTVDTQSLIAANKMRSDCGDIRFTDSDGKTLLSYWLEADCNTANTKIWVKVPLIEANSQKTIYMYYGNPDATSQSNGDATFIFFDDFDGNSLDTNKWNIYEDYTEGSGTTTYSVSDSVLYKRVTISGFIGEARLKFNTTSHFNLANFRLKAKMKYTHSTNFFRRTWGAIHAIRLTDYGSTDVSNAIGDGLCIGGDDNTRFYPDKNTACTDTDNPPDSVDWNYVEFTRFGGTVNMNFLGIRLHSTTAPTTSDFQIWLIDECAGYFLYPNVDIRTWIDWIFLAKYTSPEPSVSIGEEEALK